MPGSSVIAGLLLCLSSQRIHGVKKPKTVTYDTEIFIDVDDEEEIRSCQAILHYFLPYD
jgi:hypothetical protein